MLTRSSFFFLEGGTVLEGIGGGDSQGATLFIYACLCFVPAHTTTTHSHVLVIFTYCVDKVWLYSHIVLVRCTYSHILCW